MEKCCLKYYWWCVWIWYSVLFLMKLVPDLSWKRLIIATRGETYLWYLKLYQLYQFIISRVREIDAFPRMLNYGQQTNTQIYLVLTKQKHCSKKINGRQWMNSNLLQICVYSKNMAQLPQSIQISHEICNTFQCQWSKPSSFPLLILTLIHFPFIV